jgi:hypothetical protein
MAVAAFSATAMAASVSGEITVAGGKKTEKYGHLPGARR